MKQLDQLKAMRDEAVKMRDEAKVRLEAKLREIQNGPDARLIEGLGPIIDGYEKVLGPIDDDEPSEPRKSPAKKSTSKKATVKKTTSTKPKLMSHKELTQPKAEKADTEVDDKPVEIEEPAKPVETPIAKAEVTKADVAPEPAPEPKPAPEPEPAKPAAEEMSLEDSLEAELLGEFGKS